MENLASISLEPIGLLRTPYKQDGFCPSQPVDRDKGIVTIELKEDLEQGLRNLKDFSHIIVLHYLDRAKFEGLEAKPPWAQGRRVGLFASRSPHRPCPIAISIVKLKSIQGATLTTTSIDAYDRTPVLDIKPYIPSIDSKTDANHGWIEDLTDWRHTMDHATGVAHEHQHAGDHHNHNHDHGHDHEH